MSNATTYAPFDGGAAAPASKEPTGYDVESGAGYAGFADRLVRQGFIRKVYGILSCQLAVTFGVVSLFTFNPSAHQLVQSSPALLWAAIGVYIATAIMLTCCGDGMRRTYPMNMILLSVFTLATSWMVGAVAASYDADVVGIAMGITFAITIGLTVFACQTKYDFTIFSGVLVSLTWALLLFGILAACFRGSESYSTLNLFYAAGGAFLFACFIVVDTQMIMGGKRSFTISPDDYVYAALQLYLDIVNLFLKILRLVAAAKRK